MTETDPEAEAPRLVVEGRTARAMLGASAVDLALPTVPDRQILASAHLRASGYRGEGVEREPPDGHDLVAIQVSCLALALRGGVAWRPPSLRAFGRDPVAHGEAALTSIVDLGLERDPLRVVRLAAEVWAWFFDLFVQDAEAAAAEGFRRPPRRAPDATQ